MKQVKKLELKRKTIETLGNSEMSNLRGGDMSSGPGSPLYTAVGGRCLGTPKPTSGFASCA